MIKKMMDKMYKRTLMKLILGMCAVMLLIMSTTYAADTNMKNGFKSATVIELNKEINSSLIGGETRYFKFNTTNEKYYNISPKGQFYMESTEIYLYDGNENEIQAIRLFGDYSVLELIPNSTYYISILSRGMGDIESFSIRVTALADDCGDTMETSSELIVNDLAQNYMDWNEDQDYYRFTTGDKTKYRLQLMILGGNNVSGTKNLQYDLLDKNGKEIGHKEKRFYYDQYLVLNEILAPNTIYYLRVRYNANYVEGEPKTEYAIEAVESDFETPTWVASAPKIQLDTPLSDSLEADEVKYYQFKTSQNDSFYLIWPKILKYGDRIEQIVYDENFNQIKVYRTERGDFDRYAYKLKPNAIYYVSLSNNSRVNGYSLNVNELKDDCGDDFESSNEILINNVYDYTLDCMKDEDIVRFTTGPDNVHLLSVNCERDMNQRLELFDEKGNLIEYAFNERTRIIGVGAKLKPNTTYYAKYEFDGRYNEMYMKYHLQVLSGPTYDIAREKITLSSSEMPPEVTTSKVLINGEEVAFDAYNIKGSNYFKLRDLAMALSGNDKQFEVTWDGGKNAINLISDKAYTIVGGELTKGKITEDFAYLNTSGVFKDGQPINLVSYTIDNNNYFRLRDVGRTFNFSVTWKGTTNTIIIDTNKNYGE